MRVEEHYYCEIVSPATRIMAGQLPRGLFPQRIPTFFVDQWWWYAQDTALRQWVECLFAAIERDEEELMHSVNPWQHSPYLLTTLIVHAGYYNARKCYKALLQKIQFFRMSESSLKELYFAAIQIDAFMLTELTASHINLSLARTWRLQPHNQTGLLVYADSQFLYTLTDLNAREIKESLGCLLSIGENPFCRDNKGRLPLDYMLEGLSLLCRDGRRNSSDILKASIQDMLFAMKQWKGNHQFVVPWTTVNLINEHFRSNTFWGHEDSDVMADYKCIKALILEIMELILVVGADLKESDENRLQPLNLYLDEYDIPGGGQLFEHDISHITLNQRALLLHNYDSLLLSYGHQPCAQCFQYMFSVVISNLKPLVELIPGSMSMMEPHVFREFQRFMKERCRGTEHVNSINFCLSLKDQCRRVLYQSVPQRRMAAHVKSLPLPKPLKKYLVFDRELPELK